MHNIESAATIFRETLSASPLWTSGSTITGFREWIGVNLDGRSLARESDIDLNLIGGACYLLYIGIPESACGQGHGSQLYNLICEAAGRVGMGVVIQTPSGNSANEETRFDWLLRRGWVPHGDREVRKVVHPNCCEIGGVLTCRKCEEPFIVTQIGCTCDCDTKIMPEVEATGLYFGEIRKWFPSNLQESPADRMAGQLIRKQERAVRA